MIVKSDPKGKPPHGVLPRSRGSAAATDRRDRTLRSGRRALRLVDANRLLTLTQALQASSHFMGQGPVLAPVGVKEGHRDLMFDLQRG
jgi:hypothetical protein